MDKILVKISVPSIGEVFDVFVSVEMPITELVKVIASGVKELSNGRYGISGQEMLITEDPPALLDSDKCLMDYDIHDGKAMLMI